MSSEISDKSIWITGASSGIGKALVARLVKNNNFVLASGRDEKKLADIKEASDGRVDTLAFDLLDEDDLKNLGARLADKLDYLDMVIICAGTCEYDDGPSFDIDLYKRVLGTNYFGTIHTLKAAMPLLKKSEKGSRIVGVSSLAAVAPFPRAEAYGASKIAMEYFLKSVKVDVADSDIELSIVRPGFVDTPLTRQNDFEMPFLINPEEAADSIINGVAKGKRTIEFPTKMKLALGVARLLPGVWMNSIAPNFKKPREV